MNNKNIFSDLAFVTIGNSARYKLVQDGPGDTWGVQREGESVSDGHRQKWAARIAALKEADTRNEIPIMEGE